MEYLDWEAIYKLDMAANMAAQVAVQEAVQMEGGRGRARGRGGATDETMMQMQATRDASVMLGHNIRRHQRSISVMSDYFDAVGEEHIENDEHEYGSIFSTLATHTLNGSIGQAMRDWHAKTNVEHDLVVKEEEESMEIGEAMKQWHARTRMKRRGTGRGMDIMASNFDLGEWEGMLGKMLAGWEESVLAFVLLVVMFRLWLLDAFGGRI